jgi:hypothetical protein
VIFMFPRQHYINALYCHNMVFKLNKWNPFKVLELKRKLVLEITEGNQYHKDNKNFVCLNNYS